jgi:hypothetical protein
MRHKRDTRRLWRQQDPWRGKSRHTGGDSYQKIASSHGGPPVAVSKCYPCCSPGSNYPADLARWTRLFFTATEGDGLSIRVFGNSFGRH